MKHKLFYKRILIFVVPIILGILIGSHAYNNQNEEIIKVLRTISVNILAVLQFLTPFLVLCLTTTALYEMSCTKKEKLKSIYKMFKIVFITLIPLTLVITAIALIIMPLLITDLTFEVTNKISVYKIPLKAPIDAYTSIIIGFLLGMFTQEDSIVAKVIYRVQTVIVLFFRYIMAPIMPLWILCVYAAAGYNNSSVNFLKNDITMFITIIILQGLWLTFMYGITSLKVKKSVKQIWNGALKVIGLVLSLGGNGGAIILPYIVKEQVKLGYDEQKSKLVTATSLNMPGSHIANIIIVVTIISSTNMDFSIFIILKIMFIIMLQTIIAPPVPGGTAALVSVVLDNYGFSSMYIDVYNAVYIKQGPTNASVNNAADLYITPNI